jgi:hypothetical protein
MPVDFLNKQQMSTFLLTYLAVIAGMLAIGYLLANIKEKHKHLPFIVRFIIGS